MNNYSLITGHNYQTTYDLHVPAAKSHTMQLNESPRTAVAEVDDAIIFAPVSNLMLVLFHSTTPCLSHTGKRSYANLIRSRISVAVFCLFARIATL